MDRLRRSVLFYGCCSAAMGIVLLFFPENVRLLFDLLVNDRTWLNLLGFVLIGSSYCYIWFARANNKQFALYTNYTRFAAPLVAFYLMITGKANWHFISCGIVGGLETNPV